jgi:hypothetical protein
MDSLGIQYLRGFAVARQNARVQNQDPAGKLHGQIQIVRDGDYQ